MTRKIKFRGKNKKNGEWFYGNLFDKDTLGRTHICTTTKGCLDIDPNTIGQFTGLYDKNGKEIYEGDIVEYDWYIIGDKPAYRVKKQVVFDDMGARVGDDRIRNCTNVEVVGNIHDNPELLKTETL